MTVVVPAQTVPVSVYADGVPAVHGNILLRVVDAAVPPTLCQFIVWQCVPLVDL